MSDNQQEPSVERVMNLYSTYMSLVPGDRATSSALVLATVIQDLIEESRKPLLNYQGPSNSDLIKQALDQVTKST